jgi:HAD superfamily hydrolase (TIGR01509 family)
MTRSRPTRAVVFDLDGTLIDSLPLVLASIAHALEPFGVRTPADILARLGGPPERFMAPLLGGVEAVPQALARYYSYHHENVHLVRPYQRATRVLEELRQAGVRTAIWTGRDRVSTAWLLREHRLEGYLGTVVCGDDLPSHKPDSAGLREILRRLEVEAPEALFVGDADVDVLGGVGCGVDTLLIRHARVVDPSIVAQAWRSVASPEHAYDVVLDRIRAIA